MSGVLEARDIPVKSLKGELEGSVEKDVAVESPGAGSKPTRLNMLTGMLMRWDLEVPSGRRDAAEKALRLGHQACAVFQSLQRGIEVETSWEIDEKDPAR